MKDLHRIGTRLLAEPWLIRNEVHRSLHAQYLQALAKRDSEGLQLHLAQAAEVPALRQPEVNMDCLSRLEIAHGVAILPVRGVMGKNLSLFETMCGGCDYTTLAAQAMALEQRGDVRTVMMHLNTPGGAVHGLADCADVFAQLAQTKRLVAYVDEACSAGFWLACQAERILIGKSAVTGSIGSMASFEDLSAMYAEAGISVEVFRSGPFKGAGVEGTSLTEAQRAEIQNMIERCAADFKDVVRASRPQVTEETMQGQWFYGAEAVGLGLADEFAPTLEHAIAAVMD